jgi:phage shock protein A
MQWLQTFSLVLRSNCAALTERFENPERVLHQLILDMEDELERVRGSVAGVLADEIQLGKQVEKARDEVRQWQERAEKAIKRRDETQAKQAIEQKVLAEQRLGQLEKEYAKQKDETVKLHRALHDLEHKIRQARHKRSLLSARIARADSARTVNSVLRQTDTPSALAQFQRLEDRVDRAEALEEAYDRLGDRAPEARDLEREFEERDRQDKLQREFEELKRRLDETPS